VSVDMQWTSEDLRAIHRALREHADGKQLRKEFVRQLGRIARPLVPKVKAAWLAAPSQGHGTSTRARQGQPDLRALLAKSTRSEVRLAGKQAGVRVRTDGRKMPSGMRALPTYAEGTKPRWRHPAYGNRGAWAGQRPFPRFYATVQPNEQAAQHAAEQAVQAVFQQIVRAR
jgi:hypothetical protein